MIRTGHKHLAFAKREIVAAIHDELLVTDVAVALMGNRKAMGGIVRKLVERAGPLVIGSHLQPVLHGLRQIDLHSVEFGVLIVASVSDALSPAAIARREGNGGVW